MNTQQPVSEALSVQAIENELAALWTANAHETDDEDAMIRARVMNILAFVSDEKALHETDEILFDVAAFHPCRALLMLGQAENQDKDIKAFVSSRCHVSNGADHRHLCIEQVTMQAYGRFAEELPSAALPLLVPDLPAFLWWRADLNFEDLIFKNLARAVDHVIIDSTEMRNVENEMLSLASFLKRKRDSELGLSDLNWARITEWRSLVATLFDSPDHRALLDKIVRVEVDFSSTNSAIAPKALLMAGWFASRLNWRFTGRNNEEFVFESVSRKILLSFNRLGSENEKDELYAVRIITNDKKEAVLAITRSVDNSHLQSNISTDAAKVLTGTFICTNECETDLLIRELEILHHDRVYEGAVSLVAGLFQT